MSGGGAFASTSASRRFVLLIHLLRLWRAFSRRAASRGRCEYAPLFWALEAACGDGFDEGRRAVEMISARLDHDVDAAQGLNHHSWTEGSLTAMAVAAAIEAAGPAPDPNREVTPSERERGAVERDPETRPRTRLTKARRKGATPDDVAAPDDAAAPPDPPVHPEIMRASLENVERGFRDTEYAYPPELFAVDEPATRDAPDTDDRPTSSIASTTNGSEPSTSSSTSSAPEDLRTAAALAAARAAAADVPMVVKLPDVAGRSRFRGKNRGALGASRFDRKTRAASLAAAAKSARAAAVWRGVGVRTRAGLVEEPRPRTSATSAAEDSAARAAVEDDDPPGDRLPEFVQAIHAELDDIGAASQASDRPPRVADVEAPAAGFFSSAWTPRWAPRRRTNPRGRTSRRLFARRPLRRARIAREGDGTSRGASRRRHGRG